MKNDNTTQHDIDTRISHLEKLGCTDVQETASFIDFTAPDGVDCNIGVYDFAIADDLHKILKNAMKYTCCGDLIEYDGDSDLCPTCKEHC